MDEKRTLSEYIDERQYNYAKYVVENRAIPSVIDGFKPTQRKIVHIARKTWKDGGGRPMKVFQFAGKVSLEAFYHHGDTSCNNAIISLAQPFKNNLPLLDKDGQVGTLRNPVSGAPRYVGCSLHSNFHRVYKDNDLLEPQYDEGHEIEPRYFLPIIPMVLVNGISGIAVGFSSLILNRDPVSIIDACLDRLKNKSIEGPLPYFPEFDGRVQRDGKDPLKFIFEGTFERVDGRNVKVSELPPSLSFDDYEKHLMDLEEKGEILYFDNNCTKERIEYIIKFKGPSLKAMSDADIVHLLKLRETRKENLTTLDPEKNIKVFDNVEGIIEYFVDFRYALYEKRKEVMVRDLEGEIGDLSQKVAFLDDVIKGKVRVSNRTKKDIVEQLEKRGYKKTEGGFAHLLRIPIFDLTYERMEELRKKAERKESELERIKKRTPKKMYMDDLRKLKEQLGS